MPQKAQFHSVIIIILLKAQAGITEVEGELHITFPWERNVEKPHTISVKEQAESPDYPLTPSPSQHNYHLPAKTPCLPNGIYLYAINTGLPPSPAFLDCLDKCLPLPAKPVKQGHFIFICLKCNREGVESQRIASHLAREKMPR